MLIINFYLPHSCRLFILSILPLICESFSLFFWFLLLHESWSIFFLASSNLLIFSNLFPLSSASGHSNRKDSQIVKTIKNEKIMNKNCALNTDTFAYYADWKSWGFQFWNFFLFSIENICLNINILFVKRKYKKFEMEFRSSVRRFGYCYVTIKRAVKKIKNNAMKKKNR